MCELVIRYRDDDWALLPEQVRIDNKAFHG